MSTDYFLDIRPIKIKIICENQLNPCHLRAITN